MSNYQSLLAAAQSGALILTANERLFRYLRGLYDKSMQDVGKQVWDTPQIISYQGWLNRSLNELGEGWRLLEKNQALRLWERLIEDSSHGSELELLQVSKTAEKAYEAFQSLSENDLTPEGQFLTDDQQVFHKWLKMFTAECDRQEWLDRSQLAPRICRALQNKDLTLPQQILLVGFDQLPPGAELLRKTCRSLGGACDEFQLQTEVAPGSGYSLHEIPIRRLKAQRVGHASCSIRVPSRLVLWCLIYKPGDAKSKEFSATRSIRQLRQNYRRKKPTSAFPSVGHWSSKESFTPLVKSWQPVFS